jgi:hypothetical protein
MIPQALPFLALALSLASPSAQADGCGAADFDQVKARIADFCQAALHYRVDQAHISDPAELPALERRCRGDLEDFALLKTSPKTTCASGPLNVPDDAYGNTSALFKSTIGLVIPRKLGARANISVWLEDCQGYDVEHDPHTGATHGTSGLQRYLNQFAFVKGVTAAAVCP